MDFRLTYTKQAERDLEKSSVTSLQTICARQKESWPAVEGQAINALPDGTPNAYRIVDPRQFILTVTFDL